MEEKITAHIARTIEKMVAKENWAFVAESQYDFRQFAYKNTCTGVRPIISNLIEQVLLDLIRGFVNAEILERHVSTY